MFISQLLFIIDSKFIFLYKYKTCTKRFAYWYFSKFLFLSYSMLNSEAISAQKSVSMSTSSSKSRFYLIAHSQNSSNKMNPPWFLSIIPKAFYGSLILTPQFSIRGIALRNSLYSIRWSPEVSILSNITQYSKYYLR